MSQPLTTIAKTKRVLKIKEEEEKAEPVYTDDAIKEYIRIQCLLTIAGTALTRDMPGHIQPETRRLAMSNADAVIKVGRMDDEEQWAYLKFNAQRLRNILTYIDKCVI
jgi:hypothetical protein